VTKKHFIALADYIRDHNEEYGQWPMHPEVIFNYGHLQALAEFLQEQNRNFDKELWLDYIAGKCGPSGGELR